MRINPSLFEAHTAGKRESETAKKSRCRLPIFRCSWRRLPERDGSSAVAVRANGAVPHPHCAPLSRRATKRSATERALKGGAGSGAGPGGVPLPPHRGAAASAGCGRVFSLSNGGAAAPLVSPLFARPCGGEGIAQWEHGGPGSGGQALPRPHRPLPGRGPPRGDASAPEPGTGRAGVSNKAS